MPPGISKTGTLELSYFQNWYSWLLLFFQKELFHKPETFEEQRQPRVPVLEGKKVPKYQFLKYQVADQAVFKMMSKKKEEEKSRKKWKKNELLKWKKIF